MNSRLEVEEMESLRQLALKITSELDRDVLLQTIIRSAVKLLYAKGGGIYEYDPDTEELKVIADWGHKKNIEGHTLKFGEGLAGQVVKERIAMNVPDYSVWEGRSRKLDNYGFKAVVAAPLETPKGGILGVLYVTNSVEGSVFSERDEQLLRLLASHAAIAMKNAEVLAEKQQSLLQLELISKFNENISAALDLNDLLQITLKEALRAVEADEGSIMIVDQKTKELKIEAWFVHGDYVVKDHPVFKLEDGIAGHVAVTGKPYYCPDTSKDKLFLKSFTGRSIRSLLSVPIISHGLVLGVVSADNEKINAFNDSHVKLFTTLAEHVALAIESQRLRDVSISLSTLSEDDLYMSIAENACILTGSDVSTIFLKDVNSGDIKRAAMFSLMGIIKEASSIRDGGLTYQIMRTGEPVLIADAQNHPNVKPSVKKRGIQSLMGMPLNVRLGENGNPNVTIGVLYVNTRQEYGKRDEEILQSLASQAAIAITKARLYKEVKRERDSSQWMAAQLLTLYKITEEMQSEPNLSRLLNLLSEQAAKLLGANAGGTLFWDAENSQLSYKGSHGLSETFLEEMSSIDAADALLAREVVQSRRAIIANDLEHNGSFANPTSKKEGIKAAISTPLIIKSAIIGTLDVYNKKDPQAFDHESVQILSLLANQAALAIENTRILTDLVQVQRFQDNLLKNAFDAIVATDGNGIIRLFNDSAERTLGYTREEATGMHVSQLFYRGEDADLIAEQLSKGELEGRMENIPTVARHKSDGRISVRLSVSRLEKGGVGFFRDQRDIEGARQHIEQLTSLLETVQAITALTDQQSVLETTVDKTMEMLKTSVVCLYLYDQESDKIYLPPTQKGLRHHQGPPPYVGPGSIIRRVLEGREIHFSDDAQHDSFLGGDFIEQEKILSCAACPLRVGDKVVGVLFCNYRTSHPFTDAEKAMIRLFTSEVAITIENARLYSELQQRAEQLQALNRASLGLTADLSFQDILQTLVESARTSTNAQYAALGILTEEWKLQPFVSTGFDHDTVAQIGHPPEGKGVLGVLLQREHPINVSDVTKHRDFSGEFPAHHPVITSFLGVPIMSQGQIIGNLYVANKIGASVFSQVDELNIKLLARQSEIVIERANSQDKKSAIQTVNIAFLLLSRWARTVRRKSLALEEDLKKIQGILQSEDANKILKNMRSTLHELDAPRQSLQLEIEDNLKQTVNLTQLIKRVVDKADIKRRIESAPQLRLAPACIVMGNELLLEFALNILVENAVEEMEQGAARPGLLSISCQSSDQLVQVHISDTAGGISPEIQKHLYRKPLKSGAGTGYGSLAAGMIVRVHKGNIRIVKSDQTGTSINFWIPLAS